MSIKASQLQADLLDNSKLEFKVGNKKYKIARLSNWVALKMSKYILNAESLQGSDLDRDAKLKSIVANRTIAPKCISLMMLKSAIKVKLFHWFKWRQLHYLKSQEDYAGILDKILNDQDTMFFFQNMASLQASNILESQMTEMSTKNIIARHTSEG